MDDNYNCSKGASIETLCLKIENIEKLLTEMRNEQKDCLDRLRKSDVERARYPPPGVLQKYLNKVNAHDIYFGIMGSALLLMLAFASGGLQKLLGWD